MDNINYNELFKWIDEQPITRQKKNIHRDFSDAVPLAEILKQHFPKLVELHNYSPQNALSNKLVNWETLNKRVLGKLKINLTHENMMALSKGNPGAIEHLLHEVKTKIEARAAGDRLCDANESKIIYIDGITNYTGSIIPVRLKNGSKIVEQKMMPNEIYENINKSIVEKDDQISIMKNKIEHLESLLAVKEERIKDLTQQLQSLINKSDASTIVTSPKARFFDRIFQT